MQNTNYVFLNAEDCAIVVSVNNSVVGFAYNAKQLVELFIQHNINVLTDDIYCSSSLDFATEEGFATDSCAHNIIDAALDML